MKVEEDKRTSILNGNKSRIVFDTSKRITAISETQ